MCLEKIAISMLFFWLGDSFLAINSIDTNEALIELKPMIVTAYYKPLPPPNQKKYIVSYKMDRRINGTGEKTSSGITPAIGTVAADGRFFPEGKTDVYVPGYGMGTVNDTGGNINGPDRLDVFVGEGDEGREKAVEWGVKEVTVMVIRNNKNRA
jgi:3D (Asp-Asp-Asp) domain-containing protein